MPKVSETADRLYGPLAPGFGKRVAFAIGKLGTRVAAAKAMGVSTDQVAKIIAESSVPNFASIAALARASGVPLRLLAFGNGSAPDAEISTGTSFTEREGDLVWINDVQTSATYPFARGSIARLGNTPDGIKALEMPNAAMEPTIARDDLLLLDVRPSVDFADGAIMVLPIGKELAVRRVQIVFDSSVLLTADNTHFPTQKLTKEEAAKADICGRVVWRGSSMR
jgi:SOS-response transcriptional repressor LexA